MKEGRLGYNSYNKRYAYNEDGKCHRKCRRNVIENVIEILRKIKWLKSEYSKKKLSKERRLKSFLKNEYFKVSLNEVSRDLRLSETL